VVEVNNEEKDIVQLWQHGKDDVNVVMVERERIQELIEVLQKELNAATAECGTYTNAE
jgi:hypothetical protein